MKIAGAVIGIIILVTCVRASQAQHLQRSGRVWHKMVYACQQEDPRSVSDTQKQTLLAIQSKSEQKAKPDALRVARIARQIYNDMLSDHPDAKLRLRLSKEMDDVVLKLLHIKGNSIREAVRVLTPEQRRILKREMEKPGAPGDLMEIIAHTFHLQNS